jgi:hypothetical protein
MEEDRRPLDDEEVIANQYLLLCAARQYCLRKCDIGNTWEIHGHEHEITFAGKEVARAVKAGMVEILGDEVILGLSERGKQALDTLEQIHDMQLEFVAPPSIETPTKH